MDRRKLKGIHPPNYLKRQRYRFPIAYSSSGGGGGGGGGAIVVRGLLYLGHRLSLLYPSLIRNRYSFTAGLTESSPVVGWVSPVSNSRSSDNFLHITELMYENDIFWFIHQSYGLQRLPKVEERRKNANTQKSQIRFHNMT